MLFVPKKENNMTKIKLNYLKLTNTIFHRQFFYCSSHNWKLSKFQENLLKANLIIEIPLRKAVELILYDEGLRHPITPKYKKLVDYILTNTPTQELKQICTDILYMFTNPRDSINAIFKLKEILIEYEKAQNENK